MAVEEMPSHNHTVYRYTGVDDKNFDGANDRNGLASCDTENKSNGSTGSTGGGSAHNNIQPSKAVYAWLRTA